jgi:hypothetical protein
MTEFEGFDSGIAATVFLGASHKKPASGLQFLADRVDKYGRASETPGRSAKKASVKQVPAPTKWRPYLIDDPNGVFTGSTFSNNAAVVGGGIDYTHQHIKLMF